MERRSCGRLVLYAVPPPHLFANPRVHAPASSVVLVVGTEQWDFKPVVRLDSLDCGQVVAQQVGALSKTQLTEFIEINI